MSEWVGGWVRVRACACDMCLWRGRRAWQGEEWTEAASQAGGVRSAGGAQRWRRCTPQHPRPSGHHPPPSRPCPASFGEAEALRRAAADGMHWLLHLDPDELLHPGG